MRTRLVIAGLVTVLAACGSGSGGDGRADGSGGGGKVATRTVPTAADAVVFRVDTRGGYTTADYQLSIVPQVSVFGDGRVVVTGPVTEQYPPHALPNLLTGTLAADEIARLADRAVELGLLERADYGQPGISDAPTATVTIAVDGRHEQSAYALDFEAGESPRVTATQRDARNRLRTFVRAVEDAAVGVATEPFAAEEVAVYVRPAASTDDGAGVEPGRASWPLPSDLATVGGPRDDLYGYRCVVLTGDDARTALAAAADATSITQWRSSGASYNVTWRPLLADEHTCPGGP